MPLRLKLLRVLFWCAAVLLLITIGLNVYRNYHANQQVQKMINSGPWKNRVAEFKAFSVEPGEIIFLGNSLIQNFHLGVFNNSRVRNFGIVGDFTEGVLRRLDAVTSRKPGKIFIEIGINDLFERIPVRDVRANYEKIILRIKKESPASEIFITSCLPTLNERVNEAVLELNEELKIIVSKNKVHYIDLHPLFVKDGLLNSELAADEVHLSEKGYAVWQKEIDPLLR